MDWFTQLERGLSAPVFCSFFFHLRRSVSASAVNKKTNC